MAASANHIAYVFLKFLNVLFKTYRMQCVLHIEHILKEAFHVLKLITGLGNNIHLIKYTVLLLPKAF